MIRGSDGLDYEDITAKLLGEPAKTERNWFIQRLSTSKIYPLPFILSRADFYEGRGDFRAADRIKSALDDKYAFHAKRAPA
jgi:hypothetical protein